jgi:hypothetical protein
MAYHAWVQDVPIGEEVYRKIRERLGSEPLAGLVVHLVERRPDGGLRYVDVWESREACERAFADRIHPAVFGVLREVGFRPPPGEPPRQQLDVVAVDVGPAARRA